MDLAIQLSVVASLLQLVAFGFYNWSIFRCQTSPNATAWAIWTAFGVLDSSSYAAMTDDPAKYILPISSAMAAVLTFSYVMFAGKFRPIEMLDWWVLAFGAMAGYVWQRYQSATYANLIAVGAQCVAFAPLMHGIWRKPVLERPSPWFMWAVAYGLLTLVVAIKWSDEHWADAVYPVSMLCLHAAIGFLALRTQRATA